jgi:hypothetical protein
MKYKSQIKNAYYWNAHDKLTECRRIIVALKKDIQEDLEMNKVYNAPVKEYQIIE